MNTIIAQFFRDFGRQALIRGSTVLIVKESDTVFTFSQETSISIGNVFAFEGREYLIKSIKMKTNTKQVHARSLDHKEAGK